MLKLNPVQCHCAMDTFVFSEGNNYVGDIPSVGHHISKCDKCCANAVCFPNPFLFIVRIHKRVVLNKMSLQNVKPIAFTSVLHLRVFFAKYFTACVIYLEEIWLFIFNMHTSLLAYLF